MRKWSSLPRRSLVLAGTVALGLAFALSRAHLQGAIASRTRWPREFDPVAAGVTESGAGQ